MKLLDHRPPFLFVDKVIENELGKRCVAIKAITSGEPVFPSHLVLEGMRPVSIVLRCR